jgi:hypothetical protein
MSTVLQEPRSRLDLRRTPPAVHHRRHHDQAPHSHEGKKEKEAEGLACDPSLATTTTLGEKKSEVSGLTINHHPYFPKAIDHHLVHLFCATDRQYVSQSTTRPPT